MQHIMEEGLLCIGRPERVTNKLSNCLSPMVQNVNAQDEDGETPLFHASNPEIADLFRKHGGKAGEELKAEGK